MATKKKALPPPSDSAPDMVSMTLRLPGPLVAALDARVEKLNSAGQWPKLTRTDLIRNVLGDASKAWK
jgi:hypothetical protein